MFVFLALLSLLMVLIRGVDRLGDATTEREAAKQRPGVGTAGRGRAAGTSPQEPLAGTPPALPAWAVAAVAAYLAEERAVDRASASAWTRRPDR